MSGIHPGAMLAVCRVLVTFRDGLGNVKEISGTGFWVKDGDNNYFVTNRHNVDPTLKLGNDTLFKLEAMHLQLRQQESPGKWLPAVFLARVTNLADSLQCHSSSDVAVLKNPSLQSDDPLVGHSTFTIEELADEEFLAESVGPMDAASFIGFPGRDGKVWWDQQWHFPISRTVHISSWPRIPFSNDAIPTPDVILVSGLSFSGSSGSPVISHQKGMRGFTSTGKGASKYVEAKILGIMSGHWWDEEPDKGMFYHSGLSYFTRATSIRDLLAA